MSRITLTIDNRLRLPLSALDQTTADELKREFTHKNPEKQKLERQAEGAKFNTAKPFLKHVLAKKAAAEPATIPTWLVRDGVLSLPRGGRDRVMNLLEDAGYFVSIDDLRTDGTLPRPNLRHHVELRPFQKGIVEAGMRDEEGIARSPTGSGKTVALTALMVEANLPSLIIVNEAGLLNQWVRCLRGDLGLGRDEIGIIGDGEKRIRPVTVAMQQTLKNCVDQVAPYFGFVGCDEAHLFAAKTFLEVVDRFPARYRVGVTADEKRKDQKEFLLYDVIGPVIATVSEESLLDAGFILDVEVRLVPTSFKRAWWEDADPRARGMMFDRLLSEMSEDSDRNDLAAELATRIARDEGVQVLVMAHYVDHCRRLLADVARTNPSVGLLVGEDKDAYTRSLAGLMQGSVRIGVGTYRKMGTGIDIKTLSRGVAVTPVHLNRHFLKQMLGRYCRSAEGKTDSIVYVLWDREIFGLAPVENFSRWARTVTVKDGGGWTDAKSFLKRERAGA